MPDEFYIGWEGEAPPGLARFVRLRVAALLVLAAASAAVVTAVQRPFADATFEFGSETPFEGRLAHVPYPVLVVDGEDPGSAPEHLLLTAFGKRGAEETTADLDGRRVRVVGALIRREGRRMLEILPERTVDLGPAPPAARPRSLGERTYFGEVVDAKCWLGVMKPGHLKPHRGCATRCISGGVPPMLVSRAVDGRATALLLAGGDGRPLRKELVDLVAEPVEITGEVLSYDGLLVLRAEPEKFVRVE